MTKLLSFEQEDIITLPTCPQIKNLQYSGKIVPKSAISSVYKCPESKTLKEENLTLTNLLV